MSSILSLFIALLVGWLCFRLVVNLVTIIKDLAIDKAELFDGEVAVSFSQWFL